MSQAWIPITIGAAILQVWRTALQAKLRGTLSAGAAGFVRYLYALPVDGLMLGAALAALHLSLPPVTARLVLVCLGGGIFQIFGTVLLIMAFGYRNFVVGTAYAKTEAVQLVVLSVLLLGVHLPGLAILGIMISVCGVLLLSLAGQSFMGQTIAVRDLLRASAQPAALCGLGAGFCFACTALLLRDATLALPAAMPVALKALLVLCLTNALQTLAQGGYMAIRTPGELRDTLRLWRRAVWIGFASSIGSALWFAGFALTEVALVRGFGQIEIIFTIAVGHFFLKERFRRVEVLGLVLVASGVVLIAV
jgi:drug/metabolite transporter (DMT)-like permease